MSHNPFEDFYGDPVYLEMKNHLFNYRARCQAIQSVTQSWSGRSLEVGSGISPVTQNASVYTDLSQSAMKQLGKVCAVTDATQISFLTGSFDSVILSEVLEHIPDDNLVLAEIARVLKPGGQVLITVPIHSYYFASDDKLVGHQRRYKVKELIAQLERAGLTVIQKKKALGPLERLGTWLVVKIFLAHKTGVRPSGSDPSCLKVYKITNRLLAQLVRFDAWLMPEFLTSSILLVAKK